MSFILTKGVTTFVCLQEREELSRFESYVPLIESIVENKEKFPGGASVWHFPIPGTFVQPIDTYQQDMHVVETDVLIEFVEELTTRLRDGERFYIHCWVHFACVSQVLTIKGGHGRTGTVIGALLGTLTQFWYKLIRF